MQIDPAKKAELAQIFFTLSNALNGQQQQLKDQARAPAMRGQQFTADALGAIQPAIQPHLQDIKQATHDAKDALAH